MAKRTKINNSNLLKRAKRCLVGGVDSPVRSFNSVETDPVLIERGKGSKIYDYDRNGYIDYLLSWGAMILGHGNLEVVRSVKKAAEAGLSFGTTHKAEIELASMISNAIGFIEKIRFVNSGTEAVMGAIRLARGYTGRNIIVKFENSYHGHADYLLAKSGSGLATMQIPSSAGVPANFVRDTIVAPYGDAAAIEKIFKASGDKIAAVIVEPVGGNYGVIPPDIYFLTALRRLTDRNGALLIFDEVITGFRFGFGSAAQLFKITPDLIVLGKIIGGGLPVGAYGGREDIMMHLAPLGSVYQASTFAGNPIVMHAGLAALKILERLKSKYAHLNDLAEYLVLNIEEEANSRSVDLKISRYANMFSVRFRGDDNFKQFYRQMLKRGIYLAPSEFEANFLSFSHTKEDIEKTIAAARWALRRI